MVASHTNPSTQAMSLANNGTQTTNQTSSPTQSKSTKLTPSTAPTPKELKQAIQEQATRIQSNANVSATHSVKEYLTSLNHALDKIRPQIHIPTMAELSKQSDLLSVKSALNNTTDNTESHNSLYQHHKKNTVPANVTPPTLLPIETQIMKTQATKKQVIKIKADLPQSANTKTTQKKTRKTSILPNQKCPITLFNATEIKLISQFILHLSEAIFIIDANGIIKHGNEKAAQILACDQSVMLNKNWLSFLPEHIQTQYMSLFPVKNTTTSPLQHSPKEISLINANGEIKEVELSISYLPSTEPLFVIALHDMTQHKVEYSKLRKLASTDCLTSLANRRYFDEMLQYYWDECSNKLRPLSVIIIDIDYFKVFNDQFGHIQGDECLRKIAKAIAQVVPSELGLAARYGGEEFALILPYHNAKMAMEVAKQIQDKINALRFTDQGLRNYVSISASQGIASEINGQYRTSLAMLCAADTALYRAKADGRDRINTSL